MFRGRCVRTMKKIHLWIEDFKEAVSELLDELFEEVL